MLFPFIRVYFSGAHLSSIGGKNATEGIHRQYFHEYTDGKKNKTMMKMQIVSSLK